MSAVKAGDLSSIPGTQIMERENAYKLSSGLYMPLWQSPNKQTNKCKYKQSNKGQRYSSIGRHLAQHDETLGSTPNTMETGYGWWQIPVKPVLTRMRQEIQNFKGKLKATLGSKRPHLTK